MYQVNFIDAGIVAIVIAIVGVLKKRFQIAQRWIPLLPWPFAFILTGIAVIGDAGGWPGQGVWISKTVLETLKVAFASMGLFKLYKMTLLGR